MDNKIEFNLLDFIPAPLAQDLLYGMDIPYFTMKERTALQTNIAHHVRTFNNPKRVKLWHKQDLYDFADKMTKMSTMTEEEAHDFKETVSSTYEFSEYSVLMSELFYKIGIVHNAFLSAVEEYDEIGFGPVQSTSGSAPIKYFNLTDELKQLFEEYDYVRVDDKDKSKEIYDKQIRIKLKFLSFGNYSQNEI